MKKIVYFLLFALCLPIGLMAQSVDDDLYFVPSKDKQEKKETPLRKEPAKQVTNIYTSPGTTVVVRDRNGRTRDVDEYNRRYDARDNDFVMDNDTLYIKEKSYSDLDGEWVTGEFNGTQDDYEYAERIIRFRNSRFAVSISSPLYWDLVYGTYSWDWNVYTDGMYAYAFPTFSNPLWWDWRYGSHAWGWNYSWGWNYGWGWNRPYYGWGYCPSYWGGWHGAYWGGWYGGYWGHHHNYWHGGSGWGRPYYAGRSVTNGNNRSYYSGSRYGGFSYRRGGDETTSRPAGSSVGQSVRRSGSTANGRVVGTRDYTRSGNNSARSGSSYSRRNTETYTRPSSTRSTVRSGSTGSSYTRNSNSGSSYTRNNGSSSGSTTNAGSTSRRSSSYSRGSSSTSPSRSSSSSDSYSRSSNSGSSYSRSSSSGSSYSRSSSGSSGGGYSRSSGGGSSTRSSGGGSSHRR